MEPMSCKRPILLTGATGFLGRHLLHDLLVRGHHVTVLVRDAHRTITDHLAGLIAAWSDASGTPLPLPVVLNGDLVRPGLGLSPVDRARLARQGTAIVHAAARVAFHRTDDGEPSTTNVEGTRRLVELCGSLGVEEFHHVSTAFVCGERSGPILEGEAEDGGSFHNDYERSKFDAERLLRRHPRMRVTIYRPGVLVGDSRTGHTSSYQGLYRFLEMADRLAHPPSFSTFPCSEEERKLRNPGRRSLPLRMPFTGQEPCHLVPVDWVSEAIVRLVNRTGWHGRTYHLTADPVLMDEIKEAAVAVLGLEGVRWAGPGGMASPSALEETFVAHVREYWPYLGDDPLFDRSNTRAALPDLPPPRMDGALLIRLIEFARADGWGRRRRAPARVRFPDKEWGMRGECADYLECFLPENAPRSLLAQSVTLNVTVGFDVRGPGGGQWLCRWSNGVLAPVQQNLVRGADVVYRTDTATFVEVVHGRQSPQDAFFARRIDIEGDVEKALKLAVLFGRFVQEFPYPPQTTREARDAATCGD
jgi:nucleoside-diphosphate-sugar epimerase